MLSHYIVLNFKVTHEVCYQLYGDTEAEAEDWKKAETEDKL